MQRSAEGFPLHLSGHYRIVKKLSLQWKRYFIILSMQIKITLF